MPNAYGSTLRFIAAALLAAALGGCATGNIWLTAPKADAGKVEPESSASSEQHRRIVMRLGLVTKPGLSDYVTAVGTKVAAASDCPSMVWNFALLDSPERRAFSTETGHVYINRGLIELLRSENDLAAVLAHEIAHNCTWDMRRGATYDEVAVLGNVAAIGAIQPWALLSVLYIPQVSLLPAGAAIGSHNRQYEVDADRHGAEYLRRAGYPPESMAEVMDVLRDVETYERDHAKRGGTHPRWMERVFTDHPSAARRKARLGGAESIRLPDDEGFLARLDGLEFGAVQRRGMPSGGARYFPQWDVTVAVPDDWVARFDEADLWLSRKDGKARMHIERKGAGVTDDLCDELAVFANNVFRLRGNSPSSGTATPLSDLQRSNEDGVKSCTGLEHRSSKSIFSKEAEVARVGIVAPDAMPGFRFLYREYGAKTDDPIFLSIARSIKSPGPTDARPTPPAVHVRKVREGDTFALLAKAARGIPNAEAQLRLLNQRYPSGELEVGQLVKTIE